MTRHWSWHVCPSIICTPRLILFGSVTFLYFAPAGNSFTDPTGSCFSYNLSSSSPPLGLFRSVQSPPPTLCLLETLLLIRPVHALASTFPAALPYITPSGSFFFGSVTSPNLEPTCNSFTDMTGSCFSYNLSSTSPPTGSFCSVKSPSSTLRLLATLLLIRPVHTLATTFPALLHP